MCVWGGVAWGLITCHSKCVEIRGQFCEICTHLLSLHGFWALNLCHLACRVSAFTLVAISPVLNPHTCHVTMFLSIPCCLPHHTCLPCFPGPFWVVTHYDVIEMESITFSWPSSPRVTSSLLMVPFLCLLLLTYMSISTCPHTNLHVRKCCVCLSLDIWVMSWFSHPSVFLPGCYFTFLNGWIKFPLCVWNTFFFIHSCVVRQLLWFCFGALVDRKAIKIGVQESLWYVDLESFRHTYSGVIHPCRMTVLLSHLSSHCTDFHMTELVTSPQKCKIYSCVHRY